MPQTLMVLLIGLCSSMNLTTDLEEAAVKIVKPRYTEPQRIQPTDPLAKIVASLENSKAAPKQPVLVTYQSEQSLKPTSQTDSQTNIPVFNTQSTTPTTNKPFAKVKETDDEAELRNYLSWLQASYSQQQASSAMESSSESDSFDLEAAQSLDDPGLGAQPSTPKPESSPVYGTASSKSFVTPGMFLPTNQSNQIQKYFEVAQGNSQATDGTTKSASKQKKGANFSFGSGFAFHF